MRHYRLSVDMAWVDSIIALVILSVEAGLLTPDEARDAFYRVLEDEIGKHISVEV